MQLQGAGGLQRVVAQGNLSLLFKPFQVGIEFAQDIVNAGQVFARVVQAIGGFAAALLVFGDAGGFFEEQAQFLGLGLDDAADRALANDGVGTRPQPGAQKHVLHIAPAHRLVVQVIARIAVAAEHPLDGDFFKLAPLAAGAVVGIVKHQLDAGAAGRLARGGAAENHVLHRLAAQLGRLAFPQHPTHRVHDVGLAAAVGPDHAHQLPRQLEMGRIGKGLESG